MERETISISIISLPLSVMNFSRIYHGIRERSRKHGNFPANEQMDILIDYTSFWWMVGDFWSCDEIRNDGLVQIATRCFPRIIFYYRSIQINYYYRGYLSFRIPLFTYSFSNFAFVRASRDNPFPPIRRVPRKGKASHQSSSQSRFLDHLEGREARWKERQAEQ